MEHGFKEPLHRTKHMVLVPFYQGILTVSALLLSITGVMYVNSVTRLSEFVESLMKKSREGENTDTEGEELKKMMQEIRDFWGEKWQGYGKKGWKLFFIESVATIGSTLFGIYADLLSLT